MKKSIFLILLGITPVFMILCCVGCGINTNSVRQNSQPPQTYEAWLKQKNTAKMPVTSKKTETNSFWSKLFSGASETQSVSRKQEEVPQTYEEWVKKHGNSVQVKVTTNPQANSRNVSQKVQPKPQPQAPTYGEPIPNSVYENTSLEDKFAYVIKGNMKVVFFVYADCRIGKGYNSDLSSIMSQYNLYNNYYYVPELLPQGKPIYVSCKNPTTGDCVQNYLYQNCSDNVCIINPKQRRVVKISHNKAELEKQLVSLKNW